MGIDPAGCQHMGAFRRRLHDAFDGDARFRAVAQHDRPDGSAQATRFELAPCLWLEVCVRPGIPQVRVGVVTDDRWLSEDLETVIEDSGDTMSEFVELGFEEAGLSWPEPIVEHFRDSDKMYYFATPLNVESLNDLSDPAVVDKVIKMANGYLEAFKPGIRKANA